MLKFIHKLNEKAGAAAGWLAAILILLISYDVTVRKFFNHSSIAIQELEWHIFAVIFLLGAAFTLKRDRHVRVDVFYHNFTPKKKAWINLLGCLLFLLPFCSIILITSWKFVSTSFLIHETSPNPGGLPARFILKAFLPVGFILLLLQGVALLVESIQEIRRA